MGYKSAYCRCYRYVIYPPLEVSIVLIYAKIFHCSLCGFVGIFPLHLWLGGNPCLLPLQDSSQLTLLGTFSSIRGEGFKMILAMWSEYFSCLHLLGCVWTKFPAVAPTYEQSLIPLVYKYCTSE